MEKIQLQIVALSNSESSPGNFVLVLEDAARSRRLPIIIGAFEAQAIAIFMEKLLPPRPLTHDLFATTIQQLNATVKEVYIHSIINAAFVSVIILLTGDGTELHIDARTSDAVALAIRFNAAVTVAPELFETYAFGEIEKRSLLRGSMWEYSIPELEMILSDVLAKEDYESAAKVRDMIKKKSNPS
jgi:uncharacterized protein